MNSVGEEIKKGSIVFFITKYSNVLIGIVVNAIMARLLSPKDFGVVSILNVFIIFFQILSDIGLGASIIQNKQLTKRDISSIFKFSIMIAILLCTGFYFFSYLIADYLNNDEYSEICKLLSFTVLVSSLSVVPKNLILRDEKFIIIGKIEVFSSIVSGLITIVLAILNFSYYSLVWRSMVFSLLSFILYMNFAKIKVTGRYNGNSIRKIFSYSLYQFLFNLVNYFSRNLDNILVGKYFGNQKLGIYSQTYQLMMYPILNLTHVISGVLHPVLSKYVNNKSIIVTEYTKVAVTLIKLGIITSIIIYFSANEIVILLFGDQWLQVVPVLKIFCFSIWIQITLSSTGSIYQASGRTDLLFIAGLTSSLLNVSAILYGCFVGKSLESIATCLCFSFSVNFVFGFYLLFNKALESNMMYFLKKIFRLLPEIIFCIVLFYWSKYIFFKPEEGSNIFVKILVDAIMAIVCGVVFFYKIVFKYFNFQLSFKNVKL